MMLTLLDRAADGTARKNPPVREYPVTIEGAASGTPTVSGVDVWTGRSAGTNTEILNNA
jgi:hypothetical protein